MGRLGTIAAKVAPGILGAVLGAAVISIVRRDSEPQHAHEAAITGAPSTGSIGWSPQLPPNIDSRLRRMEEAVSQIQAKGADSVAPAETLLAIDSKPTVASALEFEIAEHNRAIEAVKNEAYDPKWAPGAAAALRNDLQGVKGVGDMELRDVLCRQTACLATLRWPDASQAFKAREAVLHANYSLRCGRTISMPPPDGPGAYETTVIYDCSDARWPEAN